jgi:hypothetical protein
MSEVESTVIQVRRIFARTTPNGDMELASSSLNEKGYRTRPLIRREQRNGDIYWFDTSPEALTTDHLIDPRVAAALHIGYFSREAILTERDVYRVQIAAEYFANDVSRPAYLELQEVINAWDSEISTWRRYHHYQLVGAADRLLSPDHELRLWCDVGRLLGDAAVERACKTIIDEQATLLSPTGFHELIKDLIKDLSRGPTPLHRDCFIRARAEDIRASLHLEHILASPDAPDAFTVEAISTLAQYDEEWMQSRAVRLPPAGGRTRKRGTSRGKIPDNCYRKGPPAAEDGFFMKSLNGPMKHIAFWLDKPTRAVQELAAAGDYWIHPRRNREYNIYFKSEDKYKEARSRKARFPKGDPSKRKSGGKKSAAERPATKKTSKVTSPSKRARARNST